MKKASICIFIFLANSIFIHIYCQCYTIEFKEFETIKKSKKPQINKLMLIYGSFLLSEEKIDSSYTTELFEFNDTITSYNNFQLVEIDDFEKEVFFMAVIKIIDENFTEKNIKQFNQNITRYIFYPPALMKNKINYSLDKNILLDIQLLNIKDTEKTSVRFKGKNVLNSTHYELFFQFKEIISSQ